jgi:hypothetical protein
MRMAVLVAGRFLPAPLPRQHPSISVSSEKLRKVRITTMIASSLANCSMMAWTRSIPARRAGDRSRGRPRGQDRDQAIAFGQLADVDDYVPVLGHLAHRAF